MQPRKIGLMILLLLLVSAGIPAFGQESAQELGCSITPLNQAVNIREAPSTDAPIVGQLNPTEQLNVLYAQTVNTLLWYGTESGWVASSVVGDQNCPEAVFTVTVVSGAYDVLIPSEMLESLTVGTLDGNVIPAAVPTGELDCVAVTVIDGEVRCLFPIADNIRCLETAEFEGQTYCAREMPTITPPEADEPPSGACDRYMIYEGSVVCVVNTMGDLGFPVPTDPLGARPLEGQRAPLLMIINPPGEGCTEDIFRNGFGVANGSDSAPPVDQTVQNEGNRLQVVLVTQNQLLPQGSNNPCEIEVLVLTPGSPLYKSDSSAIIARVDAVRIAPPLIVFENTPDSMSESGAFCYADNGVMGCVVDVGVSIISTWYTPARGSEYIACTRAADGQQWCE